MEHKNSKTVGEYKVTDKLLGQGSFSKVFLAYATDHSSLAVKVIPRQEIKEQELAFFESEVNLLKKCKHQNIVNFLDVKKSQTNFYIFLQYCEGGNLADYIKKRKNIPECEALKIFGQIVKGMNSMNRLKIIHRDLKPANIMLKDGNIKIVDFGLARKYSKGEMLRTFAGSPFNMAPQIIKGCYYNEKVDVYSAGTVLYEMLFGVCPFKGKDLTDLLKDIEKGNFRDCQTVKVSEKIQTLLKEMLQPEPINRIDLSELLDFMQSYDTEQREVRLKEYRKQCLQSQHYFGAMGSILAYFDMPESSQASKVAEMDLRLYGKLCKKLSPEMIAA